MKGQGPTSGCGPEPAPEPPRVPDHELASIIGRGAYGEVWLARNAVGTLRAVKVVHRRTFERDEHFEREFKGLQQFEPVSRTHEGLMDILHLGRRDEAGYFYYVMELADPVPAGTGERRGESGEWESGTHSEDGKWSLPVLSPAPSSQLPAPSSSYTPHTLRHELRTHGPLPIDRLLELGLRLSAALAHLHGHGLVHRDVKPSNVIFVNGEAKLADAGLVARMDDAQSLVGTAGYIAPEGPGTSRGDIYGLGKLLYEAAFGKDRQEFPQLPSDLCSHPDHQRLLELNEVIARACAHDAEQRYRTALELHRDLERLRQGESVRRHHLRQTVRRQLRRWAPMGALLLLGVGIMAFWWRQPQPGSLPAALEQTVFVLPFRHSAPIAERPVEYETEQTLCWCGRITDAFIDGLPLIPGIRTGSRKSDWIRFDADELRRNIVRTNMTRYLLTGWVDHSDDLLKLRLRLYPRAGDAPRWERAFEGTTNDVIGLERRAIAEIARVLGQSVDEATGRRIAQVLSNNLAAYRWFLEGRAHHITGTKAAYRKALECFGRALELDRNYIAAHVGYLRVQREYYSMRPPAEVWPRLAERANRILEIDDTCFVAQYRLANKFLSYDYDWERGIQAHDRLIAIWPDYNLSWAVYYRTLGRTNKARVYHERLKQEPELDLFELQHLAFGESLWGNHEEAIRFARASIKLAPDNVAAGSFNLGYCLLRAGRYREAIDAFLEVLPAWEGPDMYGFLGRAYARAGDRPNALEMLRRLEERARADEADPYYLAWIHVALGAADKALEYLNRAIDYRSELIISPDFGGLRTDPAWDKLRDDPRFEVLCQRVGMGQDQWPR